MQDRHRKQTMAEYTNGEKTGKLSSGTSTSSGSSKVRGVPQSFGYIKRHSAGTSTSPNGMQNGGKDATRTAQVSAVPRTKVNKSHYFSKICFLKLIILWLIARFFWFPPGQSFRWHTDVHHGVAGQFVKSRPSLQELQLDWTECQSIVAVRAWQADVGLAEPAQTR